MKKKAVPLALNETNLKHRGPLYRLWQIHELLDAKLCLTRSALGARLEVRPKTIQRDIEWMRSLGAPIGLAKGRKGYYYTKPFAFPGATPVTMEELFSLLVAGNAMGQYAGTPFQPPLKRAFTHLCYKANVKDPAIFQKQEKMVSFKNQLEERVNPAVFNDVLRAVQESCVISYSYRKPGCEKQEIRRMEPYCLTCRDHRWYMIGRDLLRNAVRTFALRRMSNTTVWGDKFKRPSDFDLDKELASAFCLIYGSETVEVLIEVDAWLADTIDGLEYHRSQVMERLPGGGATLRFRLTSLEEIRRWVLSWGTHATVLEPAELREQVRAQAWALLERYNKTNPPR